MRQHDLELESVDLQSLYDHYALERDEIRSLVLLPSTDQAAPIECSFDTANLD